jgi:hypothetical protein
MGYRLPSRRFVAICCVSVCLTSAANAQPRPRATPCPPEQLHAFDFMLGDWIGAVYTLTGTDSTRGPTGHVSNTKILTGCALEERWHFEENGVTEIDGLLLRAFDVKGGTWSYNIATSLNEYVNYRGEKDGDVWRFYFDLAADGKTTRIRITWVPTATGYSEQVARSPDAGATWALTRHINFVRKQ